MAKVLHAGGHNCSLSCGLTGRISGSSQDTPPVVHKDRETISMGRMAVTGPSLLCWGQYRPCLAQEMVMTWRSEQFQAQFICFLWGLESLFCTVRS